MTDDQTTTDMTEDVTDVTETAERLDAEVRQTDPTTTEDTEDTERDERDDSKAGREAAKYRRQLRDTEAERDELRSTVETLQRRMVEDAAKSQVSKPEALWAAGVELSSLLGDDGLPDELKIRAACKDASERLGLSRPTGGNYVPNEGKYTGGPHLNADSFADAFGPKH